MLETKEQKKYFFTVVILILLLTIVSLWNRGKFSYVEVPLKNDDRQIDVEAYLNYLESLNVDSQASKETFKQVIDESDIRRQIEEDLRISQIIVQPEIESKLFAVTEYSGKDGIIDYLSRSTGLALYFSTQAKKSTPKLFASDIDASLAAKSEFEDFYQQLLKLETPEEAIELQRRFAGMYEAYGDLLSASESYARSLDENPWDEVYRSYVIVNEQAKLYDQELEKIENKYKLAGTVIAPYYIVQAKEKKSVFVKTAHALFGVGDITITMGDIPRIIREAVEEGLANSFSKFMGRFLEKVIAKIEENYLIANFLFYSDALVSGQYIDDYLTKYVQDSLDRKIIKKFIPKLQCGSKPQNLQPVFKAKAQEYLGFDPSIIDPNDPDYYEKMARVGNYLASPGGWKSYYEDLASQAETEAEKAAERELISPGLKAPRDIFKNSISISINNIVSAQRASFNSLMSLGVQNSKNFISEMVSKMTETLVNKFVFRGATGNNSPIGVLKEQSTCLAAAQINLVLPTSDTLYSPPAPAPDANELLRQECAKYPRGCQDPNAFNSAN